MTPGQALKNGFFVSQSEVGGGWRMAIDAAREIGQLNTMVIIAALYQFHRLEDLESARAKLLARCDQLGIRGTFILAHEGINGTVAGARESINVLRDFLRDEFGFDHLEYKESFAEETPLQQMKIKIKQEIVTLRHPGVDPTEVVGEYVAPADWNDVISKPGVTVIDTRNDYEVAIGTFEGAIDPKTDSFHDFPKWVEDNLDPKENRKVAMFCTGGIRCEKASALMLKMGYEKVYHLKGGILQYLEDVPKEQSKWKGDCFVFDDRVAVDHSLSKADYEWCPGCGWPLAKLEDGRVIDCPNCGAKAGSSNDH